MTKRIPTHPGEMLREEVLPALGLSVAQFADALGVTRQTMHRLLAEKASVSPGMACRLGKALGNGPELWLGMQSNRDLAIAESFMANALAAIPNLHTQEAQS